MKKLLVILISFTLFTNCTEDSNPLGLDIPVEYISLNYNNNVTAEATVIDELNEMTANANTAETNAQSTTVSPITYPTNLQNVTLTSYRTKVTNWLTELVNAANSPDGFQNPGVGNSPAVGQQGGLLGTRLLDEYGLELEQMVEKGSFGAALYNHATNVIENIKNGAEGFTNSSVIDRLVEIHGTDASFNPTTTTAAATYSKRRSNLTAETGFFYDIKTNLITAKVAMEAGASFNSFRNAALDAYLLNWEKSNFATVIFYCKSTKDQLTAAFQLADGPTKDTALGNAMHAYAEGVAFAHGFRDLPNTLITNTEIDAILTKFLAPVNQNPESFRFLNETALLANLDDIIQDIQAIYNFTDAEVQSFYVNN